MLSNGDFPIFGNPTLIKERWLFKDKLENKKKVLVKPTLKLRVIKD